tara:strand:+ start:6236 stop:6448 length:213 start_codon:yes stop_codon:yes gene_type:complete
MIDFNLLMEDELDDFYNEQSKHNNLRMLIEFEDMLTDYDTKGMDLGKPKMRKKLTASKFIPKKGNNKSLF